MNPAETTHTEQFPAAWRDWVLLTAGSEKGGYNTMTASWAHKDILASKAGGAANQAKYRSNRYKNLIMPFVAH